MHCRTVHLTRSQSLVLMYILRYLYVLVCNYSFGHSCICKGIMSKETFRSYVKWVAGQIIVSDVCHWWQHWVIGAGAGAVSMPTE